MQEIQVLIKITIVIKNTTTPKFIFYQRSMLQVKYEIKQVAINSTNALPAVDTKNQTKPIVVPGGSVTVVPSNDQSKTISVTSQVPVQPQTSNKSDQNIQSGSQNPLNSSKTSSNTQTTVPSNSSNTQTTPSKSQPTQPVIPE